MTQRDWERLMRILSGAGGGAVEEWTIEFNSMNLEKPSKVDYGCLQDIFLRHSTFPRDRSWLYVSSRLLVSMLSIAKLICYCFSEISSC